MASANLVCPNCGTTSAGGLGTVRCSKCDTVLAADAAADATVAAVPEDPDATQVTEVVHHDTPESLSGSAFYNSIAPGSVIGDRFEVIRPLGMGGMAAVYKVYDKEVDRVAALKVIRPEMANNPEILRLFKQELALASQVTHQNVIRIYDLGVADGVRFITMQFVDGRDLRSILKEKGKFTPEEAAAVMVQVCEGLDAAHRENVVHRDLKPANMMVDKQNRVLVMDFGLAHTTDSSGNRGRLLGTPQYMSPEQARCEEVDSRSDLYTVGLIFLELLTGEKPNEAVTITQMIEERAQGKAPELGELDSSIPKALRDILTKCLHPDREQRYQSAADIARDIKIWQGVLVPGNTKLYRRLTIGFAAVLLVVAGIGVTAYLTRPLPPPKPVTVLIADFANQTGETVLNRTLEVPFGAAIEGASFINNYPRSQALSVASRLKKGDGKLDQTTARLVAQREGLNVVLSGVISRGGPGYTVKVKAIDAVSGNEVAESDVEAATKEALLSSIPGLAAPLRKALGDRTPESSQAQAGETFTSSSLEAAHEYSLAQEAQLSGKYDEAMARYQQAIARDPNMARAYSGMAVLYRNRGEEEKAEENIKIALTKPGMSQRERYRIRGASYVIAGSYEHAADEYKALLEQFPSDNAGHANVAIAYLYLRNLPLAVSEAKKAIEIYPLNVAQRNNHASFLLYAGSFNDAVKEADEVIKLNPAFERAYVIKGLASLVAAKPEETVAAYSKAGTINARGASLASMGKADVALYEGRVADAVALLRAGIKVDLDEKQAGRAAAKQVLLAHALVQSGQPSAAVAVARQALEGTKDAEILQLAARALVEAGAEPAARAAAATLAKRLDRVPQGLAKLIEGEIAFKKGQIRDAIRLMQDARKLVDTWIGRYDLGRAYLAAEAYTEADAEFDACIRRRGEATSLYLDLQPTYSFVPSAYYYAGRAQAGIGSPTAAELFKTFLAMRTKAPGDPMVIDARKRAGL